MSSQRSTRKSRGAAKVKVFDEETRKAIKRKQLDALEKDNWQEERRTLAEENDEDYVQMDEDDDSDDGAHHSLARASSSDRSHPHAPSPAASSQGAPSP